jgi:hypothetical protein
VLNIGATVYSSLAVIPITVISPFLFQKAAFLVHSEKTEEDFLSLLQIKIVTFNKFSIGFRVLVATWCIIILYCTGAVFLCLVFGMQFDRKPLPPGGKSVSSVWLLSCLLTTIQDIIVNAPLAIVIRTYLNCLYSRYLLDLELKVLAEESLDVDVDMEELEFDEDQDSELDEELTDDFIAYLSRSLIWVPRVPETCVYLKDEAGIYFQVGTFEKILPVDFALLSIQRLLLSDFGRISLKEKDIIPISRYCPHLGDRVVFQTASTIPFSLLRNQSIKQSAIVFTDPFGMVRVSSCCVNVFQATNVSN